MKVPTLTIRGKDSSAAASALATVLTLASLLAAPLYAAAVSVGLSPIRSQLVQTFPFGSGGPDPGDGFGMTLASGDFNGDGIADPASGVPYDDVAFASGTVADAGSVYVHLGAAGAGLASASAWFRLSQASGANTPAEEESFGFALTAGDFNNDGFDDLIVSHPGGAWSQTGDGAVTALLGGANPFQQSRSRLFVPGHDGVPGSTTQPGVFGAALASGDFDGDHYADLVIGAPNYGAESRGAEIVLYGGLVADGFDTGNATYWSAVTP